MATEELACEVDTNKFNFSKFGPIKDTRTLILNLGQPYLATLGQILTASFVMQLVSIGSVLLAADTLNENPWFVLPLTSVLYLLLRTTHTLLSNWTIRKGNQIAAEMTGNLIMRLGHHIALLAPSGHKKFSSGNLKTMAITDAQTLGDLVHSLASRGVGFIVAPVIAPFILYYLTGWPGLWAYACMLAMIPLSIVTSKKMMRYFDAELKLEDECTTVAGEWLKHQKTARMMLAGSFFQQKIQALKRRSFQEAKRGMYWAAFIFGAVTRWWALPPVAIIIGSQLSGSRLDLENLIGSIWYISLLTQQLTSIPDLIIRGGKAVAALKRLASLLGEPRLDAALLERSAVDLEEGFAELHLTDVSLRIDDKEILRELNLVIDLGLKTAIVGQLGSGKSSLLSIMSGQQFPSEGRAFLRGRNQDYDMRERAVYNRWRKQQVLVSQEAFIETSDIKNNICFSLDKADHKDQDILQSLYDAAMERDLANFRNGIDETLGETGINLSGGQKQRVNLARALYSKRDFLFLDDPLSAVDESVADQLWESLLKNCRGFVIATHRMKYIESCDQVIVMEGGRITSIAHPRDLISQGQSLFLRLRERALVGALR